MLLAMLGGMEFVIMVLPLSGVVIGVVIYRAGRNAGLAAARKEELERLSAREQRGDRDPV